MYIQLKDRIESATKWKGEMWDGKRGKRERVENEKEDRLNSKASQYERWNDIDQKRREMTSSSHLDT